MKSPLGYQFQVGVDEAGRGPLAGPVVAAAFAFTCFEVENSGGFDEDEFDFLMQSVGSFSQESKSTDKKSSQNLKKLADRLQRCPEGYPWNEVGDSKKLTEEKREELYQAIISAHEKGDCVFALVSAEPEEIDRVNILQATMNCMSKASYSVLDQLIDFVDATECSESISAKILIDGNRKPPFLELPALHTSICPPVMQFSAPGYQIIVPSQLSQISHVDYGSETEPESDDCPGNEDPTKDDEQSTIEEDPAGRDTNARDTRAKVTSQRLRELGVLQSRQRRQEHEEDCNKWWTEKRERIRRLGCETVVSGDSLVLSIGAASILAKVYRDRLMVSDLSRNEELKPYRMEVHKGYPTPFHKKIINEIGPTRFHRLSFEPSFSLLQSGKFHVPEGRDFKAIQRSKVTKRRNSKVDDAQSKIKPFTTLSQDDSRSLIKSKSEAHAASQPEAFHTDEKSQPYETLLADESSQTRTQLNAATQLSEGRQAIKDRLTNKKNSGKSQLERHPEPRARHSAIGNAGQARDTVCITPVLTSQLPKDPTYRETVIESDQDATVIDDGAASLYAYVGGEADSVVATIAKAKAKTIARKPRKSKVAKDEAKQTVKREETMQADGAPLGKGGAFVETDILTQHELPSESDKLLLKEAAKPKRGRKKKAALSQDDTVHQSEVRELKGDCADELVSNETTKHNEKGSSGHAESAAVEPVASKPGCAPKSKATRGKRKESMKGQSKLPILSRDPGTDDEMKGLTKPPSLPSSEASTTGAGSWAADDSPVVVCEVKLSEKKKRKVDPSIGASKARVQDLGAAVGDHCSNAKEASAFQTDLLSFNDTEKVQ